MSFIGKEFEEEEMFLRDWQAAYSVWLIVRLERSVSRVEISSCSWANVEDATARERP